MNCNQRQSNKDKADSYLEKIGSTYIFDQVSGLYKPKTYAGKADTGDEYQKNTRNPPIAVTIARDWWSIGLSVATLFVVVLYTYYTRQTLDLMQGRAWVQIETKDITLKDFPEFGLIGDFGGPGPKDKVPTELLPGEPEDPYPGIVMRTGHFPITIRNFGNVPARQSMIDASVLALAEVAGGKSWGTQWIDNDWDKYACDHAFFRKRFSAGEDVPIFPGEDEQILSAYRTMPIDTHKISLYSIIVCIAYEDAGTGKVHHTVVAYCADIPNGAPPVHAVDGPNLKYSPDLWYSPTKEFHRCRSDAD